MSKINIDNFSKNAFKTYADAANERSTPHLFDGLKPVHRRILYDMKIKKVTHDKAHKISAKIVGSVLGDWHPHGDSSVYDAAVRLAQDFKMRYPLIDFYGNVGSVMSSGGHAASRYTKMRLSSLAEYLFSNINKEVVHMIPNYDESLKEPEYLPSVFPNLLCNGSLGIGVGMSSNILPHNLTEVCNAIEMLLDNPLVNISELMEVLPGPDFPTGALCLDSDKLKDIYEFGKGSIRVRAKHKIEKRNGRTVIAITEIPFLATVEERIITSIKKMCEDYEDIYDIENNIGKNSFEIAIILEKNANVNKVLEDLFKQTALELTMKINHTVYINGSFMTLNLKEMLNHYILFQHDILIKAAKFDIQKHLKRIHLLDGLVIGVKNIDRMVQIIKQSANKQDAKIKLMQEFSLSEEQAEYILDTKLSRLTNLEIENLYNEIEKLQNAVVECKKIIQDNIYRIQIIKKQVQELKQKFGDERRTTLTFSEFNQIEENKTNILMISTDKGVTIFDADKISVGKRNTQGSLVIKDKVKTMYSTNYSNSNMWGLTSKGKLIKIDLRQYEIDSGNYVQEQDEIVDFIDLKNDSRFIVTISKKGFIKTTLRSEYSFKNGQTMCKVKEGDEIVAILGANMDDTLLISTKEETKVFEISELKLTSKVTIGSKMLADEIISCAIVEQNENVIALENEGSGKRTIINKDSHSGNIIFAAQKQYDYVFVLGESGKILKLNTEDISEKKISKVYNGKISKIATL